MSYVYWVFEDKDCFVFPHNAGYVGVSEDPRSRWSGLRSAKTVPKTAKLLILYEGTREECLRKEYQLRPSLRIGWNTLRGGVASEPRKHGRTSIAYLGHRSINSTVRYTAMAPNRFRGWEKE